MLLFDFSENLKLKKYSIFFFKFIKYSGKLIVSKMSFKLEFSEKGTKIRIYLKKVNKTHEKPTELDLGGPKWEFLMRLHLKLSSQNIT